MKISREQSSSGQNIDQYNAIHFDHDNIVVAAGAGTGKTTAMTKRVVRLIEEVGVNIDRMLILTFTNAAADVMKTRIEKALRQRAFDNPAQRQHLLEISRQVDRAHIQTFHSFCLDLIQENHHSVERIDPAFTVMSEMESEALRKKSFDRAFERLSQRRPYSEALGRVYRLFDGVGEPRNLGKYVLSLCLYAENDENFERALSEGIRFYKGEDEEGFQRLFDEMTSGMEQMISDVVSCVQKVVEDAPIITRKRKQADEMDTAGLFQTRVEELTTALAYARQGREIPKLARWTSVKCEEEPFDCAGRRYETFDELFLSVKAMVKDALEEAQTLSRWCRLREAFGSPDYLAQGKTFVEVFDVLIALAVETQKYYEVEKRKRNVVDFSDQEHFALEILSIPDVQEQVASSFSHVFVDENQDTNRVQNAIIEKVAHLASVFKVGDVKQSIYSFRNADPGAFQKESTEGWVLDFLPNENVSQERREQNPEVGVEDGKEWTTEHVADRKNRAIIRMNRNYRNRPAILSFVNTVFENEMPDLYKGGALVSGKAEAFGDRGDDDPEVVLHVYEPQEASAENAENSVAGSVASNSSMAENAPGVRELEVRRIAQKVLWLVTEKNCQFRDIAILYRSTKAVSGLFRRVFDEYHIPLELEDEGGFYEKPEIALLVSTLEGILNPYNDASFVAMLLSPFFDFTMDDLLEVTMLKRHLGLSYHYDVFVSVNQRLEADLARRERKAEESDEREYLVFLNVFEDENDFSLTISLARKITEIYKRIRWLRGISKYVSTAEFFWTLYDEQRFYEHVRLCDRGEQIQQNIALFAERVADMNLPLNECLDYLRESERAPRAGNSVGDADAVRLMTIHHSKGMEFENVVIGGIFKEFNFRDAKEPLMLNRKAGFALRHTADELGVLLEHPLTEIVQKTIQDAQRKEELRVLYVAMTRAEKRLIFMGAAKNGKTALDKASTNSIAGVVMPYLEASVFDDERRSLKKNTSELKIRALHAEVYEGRLSIKDRGLQRGRRPIFDKDYALDYGIRCHRALERCDFKQLYEGLLVDGDFVSRLSNAEGRVGDEGIGQVCSEREAIVASPFVEVAFSGNEKASCRAEELLAQRVRAYSELASVRRFLQSDMARRIACADEVYKEADFVEYTEEGKIQGIIDLYFIEKGEIVLIDYKTDVFSSDEDIERIRIRYKDQLTTYRRFLEKVYQRPVKEIYLCLLHGDGRVVPF